MKNNIPILQAIGIQKIFSGPESLEILKDISLEVFAGESIAIIGKSGSGKSSLLHILGTLDTPTKGTVSFPQMPASASFQSLRSSQIGFVFQSFHLLEDYTLIENILMPGKIARKGKEKILVKRALDLLAQVDLLEKKDYPVKLLSGGEKQRASIARSLFNNPDILFVDEPTGSLDPINARIVQNLLIESCKKHNKSLVLVTHDEEFAACCDRVFILKDGILTVPTPQ